MTVEDGGNETDYILCLPRAPCGSRLHLQTSRCVVFVQHYVRRALPPLRRATGLKQFNPLICAWKLRTSWIYTKPPVCICTHPPVWPAVPPHLHITDVVRSIFTKYKWVKMHLFKCTSDFKNNLDMDYSLST